MDGGSIYRQLESVPPPTERKKSKTL